MGLINRFRQIKTRRTQKKEAQKNAWSRAIQKISNNWDQPGTGATTRGTLEHYIQVKVLNAFEENTGPICPSSLAFDVTFL